MARQNYKNRSDVHIAHCCAVQERQKNSFFSQFYMAINTGSLLSTILTPLIRSKSAFLRHPVLVVLSCFVSRLLWTFLYMQWIHIGCVHKLSRIDPIDPCDVLPFINYVGAIVSRWERNPVRPDRSDFAPIETCDEVAQICHINLFTCSTCLTAENSATQVLEIS